MIQTLDTSVILYVQDSLRCSFLDPIMRLFTHLGDAGFIWFVIDFLLIISKKHRKIGLELLICLTLTAFLTNVVFKEAIARQRPYLAIDELTILIPPQPSYSFPSGHASSSLAAATTLALSFSFGWVAFIPAAIIAFSRVYVGVHYITDVICGAIFGAVCALVIHYIIKMH